MEVSKNWRDWLEWIILAAVAVLLVPFLMPYMDKQLVQNEYAIGVKIGVVALLIAFMAMFIRSKLNARGGQITGTEKQTKLI